MTDQQRIKALERGHEELKSQLQQIISQQHSLTRLLYGNGRGRSLNTRMVIVEQRTKILMSAMGVVAAALAATFFK